MCKKSACFVSSRSDAEASGQSKHPNASWLLPFWLWRQHLLTFSVCLQAVFNLRSTATWQKASNVNTESVTYCFAWRVLHWSIVILLYHLSLYVSVGGQVGLNYMPVLAETWATYFVYKHAVLSACMFHCVAECFMSDSLDRPGYNEIPGAERRLPVKQQMWLDSLSLPSLPTSWQSCHSVGERWLMGEEGSCAGEEMGEPLWGKGRQSPGLTLDPTAHCSPNQIVWQLKHPKCQQLYHTTDVMMMIRPYTSATDATLEKQSDI